MIVSRAMGDLFIGFHTGDSDGRVVSIKYREIISNHCSSICFMLHQILNLRYYRHPTITNYVGFGPFILSINLDDVSSTNVFTMSSTNVCSTGFYV